MTWILLCVSFGVAFGWVKVRRQRKAGTAARAE